jgi:hypothetical protein
MIVATVGHVREEIVLDDDQARRAGDIWEHLVSSRRPHPDTGVTYESERSRFVVEDGRDAVLCREPIVSYRSLWYCRRSL